MRVRVRVRVRVRGRERVRVRVRVRVGLEALGRTVLELDEHAEGRAVGVAWVLGGLAEGRAHRAFTCLGVGVGGRGKG